jgi:hypothetical protein
MFIKNLHGKRLKISTVASNLADIYAKKQVTVLFIKGLPGETS